jgi:hypothetical protein
VPAVTPPAAPTTLPGLAGLRLEALIYSDVPEKRMIFVNGRKYVEGDTIEGRLRVEEIQEDGVALSEGGRRTTLRITR